MADLGQNWDQQCAVMVNGIRVCAWCGRVAFACKADSMYKNMRPRQTDSRPCAAAANPAIAGKAQAGNDTWWACAACNSSSKRRAKQRRIQRSLTEDDEVLIRALLDLPPGEVLQLSVLKCGLRLVHRSFGYWHAQPLAKTALISGPMAAYNTQTSTWERREIDDTLQTLIRAHLADQHPILSSYRTMHEVDHGTLQQAPSSPMQRANDSCGGSSTGSDEDDDSAGSSSATDDTSDSSSGTSDDDRSADANSTALPTAPAGTTPTTHGEAKCIPQIQSNMYSHAVSVRITARCTA